MEFCNPMLRNNQVIQQNEINSTPCVSVMEKKCTEDVEIVHDSWIWLTELIAFFFFFFVIVWIMFYSLAPPLLLSSHGQVDTAKVLIASLITAFCIVVILGILRYVVNQGSERNKLTNQLEKCVNYCNK